MMRRVRARSAHSVPERAAIQLAVGDEVEVGERDSEWPAFVFVTTSTGAGWVPARYLSCLSGHAVMQAAYDTGELATEVGEILEVVVEDRPSGWIWCRSKDGREGWVPLKTLDELS